MFSAQRRRSSAEDHPALSERALLGGWGSLGNQDQDKEPGEGGEIGVSPLVEESDPQSEGTSTFGSSLSWSAGVEVGVGVGSGAVVSGGRFDVAYKSSASRTKYVKQYMLGEVLGRGSYAKVREGVCSKTARRVAVKILNKRYLKRIKNGEENVKREIKIMKKLKSHKNVTELIEVINAEEKGKMYIVLELVTGGSLQQLLDVAPNNRLPDSQAKWYFRQLIVGLEYIHSQGVVHRDIKPANLMITAQHGIKISDFGVAALLDRYEPEDTMHNFSGTVAFQPPELATGSEKFSGFKGDIWAAAVVLYLMVTGKLPFQGGTVFELFENIQKRDFTIPDYVSPKCADLIQHMLAVAEDERPSIQQILKHPWLADTQRSSFTSHLESSDWAHHRRDSSPFLRLLDSLYHSGSKSALAVPRVASTKRDLSTVTTSLESFEGAVSGYVQNVSGKIRRWLNSTAHTPPSQHLGAASRSS